MSEVKSYLRKWRRSSIFKRSSLKDKRKENWEQRIEKSLSECDDIKNLLAGRPTTPDLARTNNGTLLSKRSRAFVTEPLSNEELDKIKYMNFAMERDYRAGTRPVIPRMDSTNRRKLTVNLTSTSISADDSENNAIVKDFSAFVEISFNSLSISDEYTPQPSFSKQSEEPRTASSKSLESLWSKNVK
ncbi:hypothetical protein KDRO_C01940 [Kluyveromyces lactis]|nr:hypothetical protein KDRO_C01940 [Kluyveromyces lactis]